MSALIGFDTATSDTAVAAVRDGEVVRERAVPPLEPGGRPVHATALLVEVEQAARALGGWGEVDRIAVGVGPGSFTGLRIGVSSARALAQALGCELVAVSTLAALGEGMAEAPDAAGRPRLAILDARRGELYGALFDSGGEPLWPVFLGSPELLAERVAGLQPAPFAAGDGSLRFREVLERAGALIPEAEDPAHRVSARHVCRLGAAAKPAGVAEVEPVYIRRPDAELWRDEQQRRHDEA